MNEKKKKKKTHEKRLFAEENRLSPVSNFMSPALLSGSTTTVGPFAHPTKTMTTEALPTELRRGTKRG